MKNPPSLLVPSSGQPDTKELLVDLVKNGERLTIAELHRRLRVKLHMKLSYQAVRKAVGTLVEAEVFDQRSDGLGISLPWLKRHKQLVDRLVLRLSEQSGNPSLEIPTGSATYTFQSLYELDNFWGDLALEHCNGFGRGPKPDYISICHYTWWLLFNLGRETKFWSGIRKKGFRPQLHVFRRLPLNVTAAKTYRHVGVAYAVYDRPDIPDDVCYNVLGDVVIQAQVPPEMMKKIRKVYERTKTVAAVDAKELEQMAHASGQFTLSIYRDRSIAESILRSYGLK